MYCVAIHSPGVPWLGNSNARAGLAMSGHCGAKALHVCKLPLAAAKNALPGACTVIPCVVTKLPGATFCTLLLLGSLVGPAVGSVTATGVVPFACAPCAGVVLAVGSVATGLFLLAIVIAFCYGPYGPWC